MNTAPTPGPWEPREYSGYASNYWTISRKNAAWVGGIETMMTKGFQPRRFKTEAAARAALQASAAPDCQNCGGLGYRREANGEPIHCDLCDVEQAAEDAS